MGFADDNLDKELDRIDDDIRLFNEHLKRNEPVKRSQILRAVLPEKKGESIILSELTDSEKVRLHSALGDAYHKSVSEIEFKDKGRFI